MAETRYRADTWQYEIEPVEIERETPHRLLVKTVDYRGNQRLRQVGKEGHFRSREEAIDALIANASAAISGYKKRLERLQAILSRLEVERAAEGGQP